MSDDEEVDPDELFPEPAAAWLNAHGAGGLVYNHEVNNMKRAAARILVLLTDNQWHSAVEIRQVAGIDGVPASEGLRRLRDLRKIVAQHGLEIAKQRFNSSRIFYYRLQPVPTN